MAIQISINGNSTPDGFLIVPVGGVNFPVPVTVRTDDGTTVNATLQFSSNGANAVLSNTAVQIGPVETTIQVHATTASATRNDTVLQVLVGAAVQATFNLTGIANPQVRYRGRFQARFATDPVFYNDPVGAGGGIMFVLEDEPNFVPASGSVPLTDDQFVGRVIRFNNPEVLRSHVAPVTVTVSSVRATVGTVLEEFLHGDPVIGMPVNLGDGSYFSGNRPKKSTDPAPNAALVASPTVEPLGNFEFHIGNIFSGRSATLADRPIPVVSGAPPLSTAEKTTYGIVTLAAFNSTRLTQLQNDFNALSAADQVGTVNGRNLNTRISRLNSDVQFGYDRKEDFVGLINSALKFNPTDSSVLNYFSDFNVFNFNCKFFNFHGDEMCGQIDGTVSANTSIGLTPLQTGIYNIQSLSTGSFNALTLSEMTPAGITAVIGGAGVADHVVVTVSSDYTRIVVSKVVIANPGDPVAAWTITSRGATIVGEFLSAASIFPRDLFYKVLLPNDPGSLLGNCEGTLVAPAPQVGFVRLFADGATWKLLVHAGTQSAAGFTYQGAWAGSAATVPDGCTPLDVELLTPTINFGNVEQGMLMYKEIVLLNRTLVNVTISLPAMPVPFGFVTTSQVVIAPGETGSLLISFLAGIPGTSGPVAITLTANPVVSSTLVVTLSGTAVPVAAIDAILVLDRSGSMAEPALQGARSISKAELRNSAAQVFIDLLRPADRIGIVRFNQDAQQHMAIEAAGAEVGGSGRTNAAAALLSSDLNSSGSTSVGDGMFQGNSMLGGAGGSAKKAVVVLTDGVENNPLYIADVTLAADVNAYAIGLGLPQNINVNQLNAVTGNTGGYLLVTGALDTANEFRLHKYFAQILSGISGSSIVLDPQSLISAGQTQRVPFYISEADADFDVVLLTKFPLLRFWLEAPNGTIIDPANAASFNGQYVVGKASKYYRMSLPVFTADLSHSLGRWHIVIDYPGERRYYKDDLLYNLNQKEKKVTLASLASLNRGTKDFVETATSYSVLVRARSSVQLNAGIEHERTVKGSSVHTVVAYMKAFGLPLNNGPKLYAQITRPDGIATILPMELKGNGRYEAILDDNKMKGLYNITVKVAGQTPGNWPLQREQSLTAAIIDPANENSADNKIKDILESLTGFTGNLKDLEKKLLAILGKEAISSLPKWLLLLLIFILIILVFIFIALIV